MTFSINASNILETWECASPLPPAKRALALLERLAHVAASSISPGERDCHLLLLRRHLFGDEVQAVTHCPECAATVEISFSISDLCGQSAPQTQPGQLVARSYKVRWRLPTAEEVAECAQESQPEHIRQRLLERCLLEVRRGQRQLQPGDCPTHVIDAVCEAMALADPLGDIKLHLQCPECGASWNAPFEAGDFLWQEINVFAQRLISEIHCLAFSYGWSEQDILNLSSQRRRFYLELVQ